MGAEGIIIGVIILVLLVTFYGSQLTEFITSAQNNYLQTQSANNISIKPSGGQNVCTLKITFNPILSGTILIPSDDLKINGGAMYSWLNCHVYGKATLASLVPQIPFLGQTLSFIDDFGTLPSDIQFDGTLVADDGSQLNSVIRPELHIVKHVKDIEAIKDMQFPLTFVLTNIPAGHYSFQLASSNFKINGNDIGTPYNQNITPPAK